MVDGLMVQRGEEGNETEESKRQVGAGEGEAEKEGEDDFLIEEEERSLKEVSLAGNEEDCNEICSVCVAQDARYVDAVSVTVGS